MGLRPEVIILADQDAKSFRVLRKVHRQRLSLSNLIPDDDEQQAERRSADLVAQGLPPFSILHQVQGLQVEQRKSRETTKDTQHQELADLWTTRPSLRIGQARDQTVKQEPITGAHRLPRWRTLPQTRQDSRLDGSETPPKPPGTLPHHWTEKRTLPTRLDMAGREAPRIGRA